MIRLASLALLGYVAASASIISDVRAAIGAGDFAAGERLVAEYRQQQKETPELAAAISWLGRGALQAKQYEQADRYAGQARRISLQLLEGRELDDDRDLPIALGAAIEVQAQSMAAQGQLSEAVAFLTDELARWKDTSIRERVQKNINLLSLEGKMAPPLDLEQHIGPRPIPLARLRGRVLLLFFWAHWCPDCKQEAPILARLAEEFGSRGLTVIGPTKRYGYTARGEDATPEEELEYIDGIRQKYYGGIRDMAVPVSEENFARYGSSTTPTIVIVDREGIVRLYHPGDMPYEELVARIQPLL